MSCIGQPSPGMSFSESLEVNKWLKRSRASKEWKNATMIMELLPVHAHLLMLQDVVSDGHFVTRYFMLPACEGTMATFLPAPLLLPDCMRQVLRGLRVMHKHGIYHQNLRAEALYICRSNLFCSGYRVVIGDFSKSGAVFLHQSPLNPQRPSADMDIAAFYTLGRKWEIRDWPCYNTLQQYEVWLVLQPVYGRIVPSRILLLTLRAFADRYPLAARMLYVMRCIQDQIYMANEPIIASVTASDAELLAMAVELQECAKKYSKTAARLCYDSIIELLDLVLWETPEIGTIIELREYIKSLK